MSGGSLVYPDTFFDDLTFPASGINPPGLASDPTRSTATGLLEFSGSQDNLLAGVAQMSHKWKEGTTLHPHLHLINPTANALVSRWKFEYNRGNVNGNYENAYGVYTTLATVSHTNPNNVLKHALLDFGDLTMSGYGGVSCCILWKISRLANSDAADTDTSAIALVEFDIHYELDAPGSREELVK